MFFFKSILYFTFEKKTNVEKRPEITLYYKSFGMLYKHMFKCLQVYDGVIKDKLLVRLTRAYVPLEVRSTSNCIVIIMTADGSNTGVGFSADVYEVVLQTQCKLITTLNRLYKSDALFMIYLDQELSVLKF